MKISTKGRYALRLMVDLAVHTEDGGYAPIRSIAERQELSDKYLEQLIAQLPAPALCAARAAHRGGTASPATRRPTRWGISCA